MEYVLVGADAGGGAERSGGDAGGFCGDRQAGVGLVMRP